ncbi:MAG: CoA transferase [Bacillota bacterium]|nr:CoA transferase [Bacillota bacterium]MDW7678412.1 CoA transferase [Bacillota bacterium]
MKKTLGGPLSGVRVLDLTRVLAGPYATMMLADLGAEVIKIERPDTGDDSRQYGPFVNSESAYFMSINRNKHSITLDLKKEEGKQLLSRLIEKVDILVENFRPGTMRSLGFDYENVKRINPRIVYAAISGFGHTGPYSRRAAYDGIVQAMGGIMGITGERNGKPTRVGSSIGDIVAGLFGASGILAAFIEAKETGKGQFVDVAMLDAQVAILENSILRYYDSGVAPKPIGNMHPSIYPFQTFPTKTEELMIACGNDSIWKKLCVAIGLECQADSPLFNTNHKRGENYDEMIQVLSQKLSEKPAHDWLDILEKAGVPCSLINSIDKVVEDPQIKARNMILSVDHPVAGRVFMAGSPIKLSTVSVAAVKPAPVLGENNKEIYCGLLDVSEKEYLSLKEDRVI